MLAEAKAQSIHYLARTVVERVVRPVTLERREGATLETAKDLDQNKGNFRESAHHFHTILTLSESSREKALALIGLSQELINLGSFRQVRSLLREVPSQFSVDLQGAEWTMFLAQVKEKLGWVEDYELGYFQSRRLFTEAGNLLVSLLRWGKEEEERYSTTRHFLGRAAFGLAMFGVDRLANLYEARFNFQEALRYDEQLPNFSAAKIGFGHGWLARCATALKETVEAKGEIMKMKESFEAQLLVTPQRGLMVHYHLLSGQWNLQDGSVKEAEADFQEAIRIRTEVEFYPKGLADAYMGMASVSLREHKLTEFAQYSMKALKAHPYAAFRGIVGA